MKKKLLFLCTGNSCRSQMAEGIAEKLLSNIIIESAGTEAHGVNPIAVKVMNEISISISHQKSKKIDFDKIEEFNIIITLCGDAKDKCPIFNSKTKHIHWEIEDPKNFSENECETYNKYAEVRNILYKKIINFKNELGEI